MAQSVLEYLEKTAEVFPEREAFEDERKVLTYSEVHDLAKRIGSALSQSGMSRMRSPIAVYMGKNVDSIVSFLGVVYSGNFYCPLDIEMPLERIQLIMSVLNPEIIITDEEHMEAAQKFAGNSRVFVWESLIETDVEDALLREIRDQVTEVDPLYALFTSGSTGLPKGVLVNHKVIINYFEWLEKKVDYSSDDVFGNQAPLYFDVSVHDIYGALYFGAKMLIIPPELFAFPIKLVERMNEKKVTTFMWVPSAMSIVANLRTFKAIKPAYLRHVMFVGEVLPWKTLAYWREHLPDAVFANMYGPTETFVCTGYIMTGHEPEGEALPIGKPVSNCQALVLDENGNEVQNGEHGELCMRGDCLALGYYNNQEKTSELFVQNPLHDHYPDRIYRTGDIVYYDDNEELVFVCRKDFQIKHLGYRIELGEIESAAGLLEGIENCACIYDEKKKKIVFVYEGEVWDELVLKEELKNRIPNYMIPGVVAHMDEMPYNANGKIDRKELAKMNEDKTLFEEGKK